MQEIQNFAFDESLVRVIMRDSAPWFVVADVARALGIKNPRDAVAEFDDDEKGVASADTLGGRQDLNVLSEPGLYRLIFMSRKPDARRFQRWVTHEVLPAIRKTGGYRADAGKVEPGRSEPIPESQLFRLNLVREARLLFGPDRARGLWGQLGLPPVPQAPDTEQDEARACLRHLLDFEAGYGGATVRQMIEQVLNGDDDRQLRNLALGADILADIDRDTFTIANHGDNLMRIYRATPWHDGRWRLVLRRLPGVTAASSMRYNGVVKKGTMLPAEYLDDAFRVRVNQPVAVV